MARITPLTLPEIEALAEAAEDAVHEWHDLSDRARKSLGSVEPTIDQALAIQRQARAMMDVADALLTHVQLAGQRRSLEQRLRAELADSTKS